MTKRTDAIRALFTVPPEPTLSADNKSKVGAGSVGALRASLTDVERENDTLREQLASGASIINLDPQLVDPSPIADRFVDDNEASFEALKASIAQRGQEVPVLVREHPTQKGRYQSAYGHRRVRAARELGRAVKAVLRRLTDEDLIVAQGVENAARQDLSFIERAVFAAKLEDAGHERTIVQEALAVDRAEVSKLIAVVRAVPTDLVDAIGRAPKVGRGRWQALADAMREEDAVARARDALTATKIGGKSEGRFQAVFAAASIKPTATAARTIYAGKAPVAKVQELPKEIRVTVSRGGGFASYLLDQLPQLFEDYTSKGEDKPS